MVMWYEFAMTSIVVTDRARQLTMELLTGLKNIVRGKVYRCVVIVNFNNATSYAIPLCLLIEVEDPMSEDVKRQPDGRLFYTMPCAPG